MTSIRLLTSKDSDRASLRSCPSKRTPRSSNAVTPKDLAPTLSAGYESPILKALRWQIAEQPAIELKRKSMFDHFAPMVKIQTSGTVLPFKPYDYQSELIATIAANNQTVVTKSRQMGISETICCYLLMRSVTEPGFGAIVFSKTQDDSAKLGKRIRDMAMSLGALCPELATESAKKLAFKKWGSIDFLQRLESIRQRRCAILGFNAQQRSENINVAIETLLAAGYTVQIPVESETP